MFTHARATLAQHHFDYKQVIRTWIYLPQLLDWYPEFNNVRTLHHKAVGLPTDSPNSIFPASTGIQGSSNPNEACFMDLLAVDTDSSNITPILSSSHQPPAFSYGAGFSRAMKLDLENKTSIYISGTASVDKKGNVFHVGDPKAQAEEMLTAISAILEDHGGSLANIQQATLFCKTPEIYQAYLTVTALRSDIPFPIVPVIADVCRDEWLIEMEAIAVI